MRSKILLLLATLLILNLVNAEISVTRCMNLSTPGNYKLTNNLELDGGKILLMGLPVCISIPVSDISLDCNGFSITGSGSALAGIVAFKGLNEDSLKNITIKNCRISGYDVGITFYNAKGSRLINNTAHNNGEGFEIDFSSENAITNNAAYNNSVGFFLQASSNNNLSGNIAYNNSLHGFYMRYLSFTDELGLHNVFGVNNRITDSVAYGNAFDGFRIFNSFNNTLANVTAYGNLKAGFFENKSLYYYFETNETTNPTLIIDSNFYGNGWQIIYYSNSIVYAFSINHTKMGPVGISLSEAVLLSGTDLLYQINETTPPGPPPSGHVSFRDKYLKIISNLSASSITFHWDDGELSGFDESAIRLFNWNSSSNNWVLVSNQTTNPSSNSLTAYVHKPFMQNDEEIYGLFSPAGLPAQHATAEEYPPGPGSELLLGGGLVVLLLIGIVYYLWKKLR